MKERIYTKGGQRRMDVIHDGIEYLYLWNRFRNRFIFVGAHKR